MQKTGGIPINSPSHTERKVNSLKVPHQRNLLNFIIT